MSLSIRINAVIPVAGELFRAHDAVRAACARAGVSLPPETAAFFATDDEDRQVTAHGVFVSLGRGVVTGDAMESSDDVTTGAFVDLRNLPAGTTSLRVFCC